MYLLHNSWYPVFVTIREIIPSCKLVISCTCDTTCDILHLWYFKYSVFVTKHYPVFVTQHLISCTGDTMHTFAVSCLDAVMFSSDRSVTFCRSRHFFINYISSEVFTDVITWFDNFVFLLECVCDDLLDQLFHPTHWYGRASDRAGWHHTSVSDSLSLSL